jgi:hypothetical protein
MDASANGTRGQRIDCRHVWAVSQPKALIVSRGCLIIITDAISVNRTGEDIGNYIVGSHNRYREMRKGGEPWDPMR